MKTSSLHQHPLLFTDNQSDGSRERDINTSFRDPKKRQEEESVVRCDLGLHEDQDEDEDGRQNACAHHPNGELPVRSQRRNHPTTLLWTGDRESTGHIEFLSVNRKISIQQRYSHRCLDES